MSAIPTANVADSELPIEVRAAIDLIAARCIDADGEIAGTLIGAEHLHAELDRYARRRDADFRVVALDPDPESLIQSLATHDAHEIWCVAAGPAHRLIRSVRRTRPDDLTQSAAGLSETLQAHGYERSARIGIQGPGYVSWAIAERVLRRVNRPDLADRCRIAMLRSLITMAPFHASAITVTSFRRQEVVRG